LVKKISHVVSFDNISIREGPTAWIRKLSFAKPGSVRFFSWLHFPAKIHYRPAHYPCNHVLQPKMIQVYSVDSQKRLIFQFMGH
jgi:hypothetical protein